MNYNYGNECAKAVEEYKGLSTIQEYINLTMKFIKQRQWVIKHLDLYKKICVKNDRLANDLTITRDHMENTMDFLIAYELNKFDDDLDDVVPN